MNTSVYAVKFTARQSNEYETETYYVSATGIDEAISIAFRKSGHDSNLSPFHVDVVHELEYTEYGSTGTAAFWDCLSDTYYNHFGQRLRDPNEYDRYSDGYTPFGDE